jgi:hypothetical protein
MLVHGVVLGLTYLGLHRPHVTALPRDQRVTLRLLELHRPELQPPLPAPNGKVYARSGAVASAAGAAAASGAMPTVPKELLNLTKGRQTLVQPDLPPNITRPQEVPVPAALLWSMPDVHMATIAPPERLDTTARVSPSLRPPNHELALGDVAISSTSFTTDTPALLPSTTSPVVLPGPAFEQKVLEMWSNSTRPPAPATVISASQMEMAEGTVALPSINEVADVAVGDKLSPGRGGSSTLDGGGAADSKTTLAGTGAADSKASGSGAQNNALASPDSQSTGGNQGPLLKNGSPSSGANTGLNAAAGQTPGAAPGNGLTDNSDSGVSRIQLPKNGKFGVVIVGSSLAEQYPETQGLWGGRMAYSVYVHAGSAKNWILQYSLPRSADAAAAGENVRPDAPWPFDIVIPHGALSGFNADALMIHGFVNVAGRFEQLAIVSPRDFAQQAFMLSALREWQFRPASQNGRATAVEVLLIIPESAE